MINWGIAGPGNIARAFAFALNSSDNSVAFGVAGRDAARASAFAATHRIRRAFDSIEEMIECADIDAIYVCTPHPFHAEIVKQALNAGKHVLCEKPIALAMNEINSMYALAESRNLLLLEAYMYRFHPQTVKLVDLLNRGVVGEVRSISAAFGFRCEFDPEFRLFSPELGGGIIWDIGCYTLSIANMIASAANGNRAVYPKKLESVFMTAPNGVDTHAAAVFLYPNRIAASVECSSEVDLSETLEIFGTLGKITIKNPWVYSRTTPEDGEIIVIVTGSEPEIIRVSATKTSFGYEATAVSELIKSGKIDAVFPVMSREESLRHNAILENWVAMSGNPALAPE